MKFKKICIPLCFSFFLGSVSAQTNVSQGNLNTETLVQEICEMYATQLSFGVIDFVQTNGSVSAQGTLTLRCTKGVNYRIKVSQDGVYSDGYRKLKNKNNELITANYNLYLLGTNEIFGDGVIGKYIEGSGTGLLQSVKYEAKIQFDQTVEAGYYEDIVTVYVDY